jgi:hypothetical protein
VVREAQSEPQSAESRVGSAASRHRPRTHVRVELDAARGAPASLPERHLDTPVPHEGGDASGTYDMVAPVEMWFGEARVGVKAGTKTYAQFRKYADVLLGDLKGATSRSR